MMQSMKAALLALTLLIALPLFAGQPNKEVWRVMPLSDNLCGVGGNIHATGLEDVPFIRLVRVQQVCGDDWCVGFSPPPSEFSAVAYDDIGTADRAYWYAKLVRKQWARPYVVNDDGTTVLVTRRN